MNFRLLTADPDKAISALWGKLACEILLTHWDQALEDLTALKEVSSFDSVAARSGATLTPFHPGAYLPPSP
jgi:translation initiation factor 3 subunit E